MIFSAPLPDGTGVASNVRDGADRYLEDEPMRFYSDPSKETDPRSLSDAEVFQRTAEDFIDADPDSVDGERLREACAYGPAGFEDDRYTEAADLAGFYYWFCFPGCLPESAPFGPFETEQEAIADCRDQVTA